MPPLTHITLNNGHMQQTERAATPDDEVDAYATAIEAGGAALAAHPGYRLGLATAFDGGRIATIDITHTHGVRRPGLPRIPAGTPFPVIWAVVCLDRDGRKPAWELATQMFRHQTRQLARGTCPTREPWIATAIIGVPAVDADMKWIAAAQWACAWALWEWPPDDLEAVRSALPAEIPPPAHLPNTCPPWHTLEREQQFILLSLKGTSEEKAPIRDAIEARQSPLSQWAAWAFARSGPLLESVESILDHRNRRSS